MTLEERQKAFVDGLNELGTKYGFQVAVKIDTRQLGHVVQCEPVVIIQAIEGWKDPEGKDWQTGKAIQDQLEQSNGKPILTEQEAMEALRKR